MELVDDFRHNVMLTKEALIEDLMIFLSCTVPVVVMPPRPVLRRPIQWSNCFVVSFSQLALMKV